MRVTVSFSVRVRVRSMRCAVEEVVQTRLHKPAQVPQLARDDEGRRHGACRHEGPIRSVSSTRTRGCQPCDRRNNSEGVGEVRSVVFIVCI